MNEVMVDPKSRCIHYVVWNIVEWRSTELLRNSKNRCLQNAITSFPVVRKLGEEKLREILEEVRKLRNRRKRKRIDRTIGFYRTNL